MSFLVGNHTESDPWGFFSNPNQTAQENTNHQQTEKRVQEQKMIEQFPTIPPPMFSRRVLPRPRKVKSKDALTYRNVHKSMVAMLRIKLNEDLPVWDADTELETAPPTNTTTSCNFLTGSVLTTHGFCSKYRTCRVDHLEYMNQVR